MTKGILTNRELKNKVTGVDIYVSDYQEVPHRVKNEHLYHVIVVSNLFYYKTREHRESDVVQFMVSKTFREFEDLYKRLFKRFPSVKFPPLPKKKLIATSTTASNVECMDSVLKMVAKTQKLASSPMVISFLRGDTNTRNNVRNESEDEQEEEEEEEHEQDNALQFHVLASASATQGNERAAMGGGNGQRESHAITEPSINEKNISHINRKQSNEQKTFEDVDLFSTQPQVLVEEDVVAALDVQVVESAGPSIFDEEDDDDGDLCVDEVMNSTATVSARDDSLFDSTQGSKTAVSHSTTHDIFGFSDSDGEGNELLNLSKLSEKQPSIKVLKSQPFSKPRPTTATTTNTVRPEKSLFGNNHDNDDDLGDMFKKKKIKGSNKKSLWSDQKHDSIDDIFGAKKSTLFDDDDGDDLFRAKGMKKHSPVAASVAQTDENVPLASNLPDIGENVTETAEILKDSAGVTDAVSGDFDQTERNAIVSITSIEGDDSFVSVLSYNNVDENVNDLESDLRDHLNLNGNTDTALGYSLSNISDTAEDFNDQTTHAIEVCNEAGLLSSTDISEFASDCVVPHMKTDMVLLSTHVDQGESMPTEENVLRNRTVSASHELSFDAGDKNDVNLPQVSSEVLSDMEYVEEARETVEESPENVPPFEAEEVNKNNVVIEKVKEYYQATDQVQGNIRLADVLPENVQTTEVDVQKQSEKVEKLMVEQFKDNLEMVEDVEIYVKEEEKEEKYHKDREEDEGFQGELDIQGDEPEEIRPDLYEERKALPWDGEIAPIVAVSDNIAVDMYTGMSKSVSAVSVSNVDGSSSEEEHSSSSLQVESDESSVVLINGGELEGNDVVVVHHTADAPSDELLDGMCEDQQLSVDDMERINRIIEVSITKGYESEELLKKSVNVVKEEFNIVSTNETMTIKEEFNVVEVYSQSDSISDPTFSNESSEISFGNNSDQTKISELGLKETNSNGELDLQCDLDIAEVTPIDSVLPTSDLSDTTSTINAGSNVSYLSRNESFVSADEQVIEIPPLDNFCDDDDDELTRSSLTEDDLLDALNS